jgi:hypothetical protein
MSLPFQTAIWCTINLALGLMMALFTVAAVTMTWNHELSRRCVPFCMAIAVGFYAITQLWTFDNHGVFHLVQMLSLLLMTIGIHMPHRSNFAREM